MKNPKFPVLFLLAFAQVMSASATTVVFGLETDEQYNAGGNVYPAFWTDSFTTVNNVLYGQTPTSVSGNFSAEAGMGGVAQLTDGISPLAKAALASVGAGSVVNFALAAPTQLSSIVYYGGWVDSGRSDVLFKVSYSIDNGQSYTVLNDPAVPRFTLVGDPSRQNLSTADQPGYDPTYTFGKHIGGAGVVTNMITITDNAGAIAGGALITNLQFEFFDGRNGFDGLMELAAYAIPEPSLYGLCALGGMIGLGLRRRG